MFGLTIFQNFQGKATTSCGEGWSFLTERRDIAARFKVSFGWFKH